MELDLIKQKSCTSYLESKGFQLDKKSNKQYSFFKSPFREERTASLCVNESKNTWFDYGAGFGGDVIRLVETIENIEFKDACIVLDNSAFQKIIPKKQESSLSIVDVKELNNNNLIKYLSADRKINVDIARKYVKEVHFRLKDKNQYAIGFENDKGGFELRNKYLKISTSPKWFSTVNGNGATNIFEGFIDFLSLMTYYQLEPSENVIVLNSVSMIDKIQLSGVTKYWGDNDSAGNSCLGKIQAIDKRSLYNGFKDINDFICSKL